MVSVWSRRGDISLLKESTVKRSPFVTRAFACAFSKRPIANFAVIETAPIIIVIIRTEMRTSTSVNAGFLFIIDLTSPFEI